jgi:hypothetical protein
MDGPAVDAASQSAASTLLADRPPRRWANGADKRPWWFARDQRLIEASDYTLLPKAACGVAGMDD